MQKNTTGTKNKKKAVYLIAVLAIGIVYYAFTQLTNIYIPCPLRLFTGFVCPGCGISHLISDVISLDFKSAFQQNYAIAILVPIWTVVCTALLAVKNSRLKKAVFDFTAWASIAFLLAFGILRNIPWFSFLLPLYMR